MDLYPTLLELLGVANPRAIDGESLVEAARSGRRELRVVLAQAAYRDRSGRGLLAYIEGHRKVIQTDADQGSPATLQCFDLSADPRELCDRCGSCRRDGDAFDELRARLASERERLAGPPGGAAREMPEDVLRALESLGYLAK